MENGNKKKPKQHNTKKEKEEVQKCPRPVPDRTAQRLDDSI